MHKAASQNERIYGRKNREKEDKLMIGGDFNWGEEDNMNVIAKVKEKPRKENM